jgi:hypothetical protein
MLICNAIFTDRKRAHGYARRKINSLADCTDGNLFIAVVRVLSGISAAYAIGKVISRGCIHTGLESLSDRG